MYDVSPLVPLHAQLPASRAVFGVFLGLAFLCAVTLKFKMSGMWGALKRRWQLRHNERAWLTQQMAPATAPVPHDSINPFRPRSRPTSPNQVVLEVSQVMSKPGNLDGPSKPGNEEAPQPHQAPTTWHGASDLHHQAQGATPPTSPTDNRTSCSRGVAGVSLKGARPSPAVRPGSAKLPGRQEMIAMAAAGLTRWVYMST